MYKCGVIGIHLLRAIVVCLLYNSQYIITTQCLMQVCVIVLVVSTYFTLQCKIFIFSLLQLLSTIEYLVNRGDGIMRLIMR